MTGGRGFIGSHLVRRLLERGHEIHVIDVAGRPITGASNHTASVLDRPSLEPILLGAAAVIHLAGFVRERMLRDLTMGTRLQIEGTRHVLEAAERVAVERVILASSFYVYAGSGSESVNEDVRIDGTTLDAFGLAKLVSEQLCLEYASRGALSSTILRIGSVFGPGGSNVVGSLLSAGLRGDPIEIWGDGRRPNQYTYVRDIADGIVATLERPGVSRNEIFNLSAPDVTTTADLAELLHAEFGFAVGFRPDHAAGPSLPYVLSDKAHDLLEWRPRPLVEGLRITAADLRATLSLAAT